MTMPDLKAGTHMVNFSCTGGGAFFLNTSALSPTLIPLATTGLTASPNLSAPGQEVAFAVTVTRPFPARTAEGVGAKQARDFHR